MSTSLPVVPPVAAAASVASSTSSSDEQSFKSFLFIFEREDTSTCNEDTEAPIPSMQLTPEFIRTWCRRLARAYYYDQKDSAGKDVRSFEVQDCMNHCLEAAADKSNEFAETDLTVTVVPRSFPTKQLMESEIHLFDCYLSHPTHSQLLVAFSADDWTLQFTKADSYFRSILDDNEADLILFEPDSNEQLTPEQQAELTVARRQVAQSHIDSMHSDDSGIEGESSCSDEEEEEEEAEDEKKASADKDDEEGFIPGLLAPEHEDEPATKTIPAAGSKRKASKAAEAPSAQKAKTKN